jgi:hypothetical protein
VPFQALMGVWVKAAGPHKLPLTTIIGCVSRRFPRPGLRSYARPLSGKRTFQVESDGNDQSKEEKVILGPACQLIGRGPLIALWW